MNLSIKDLPGATELSHEERVAVLGGLTAVAPATNPIDLPNVVPSTEEHATVWEYIKRVGLQDKAKKTTH